MELYTIGPEAFPPLLGEIPDPPKQLWVQGQLPSFDSKFLCIVGSRKYSSYGKEMCQKIISGLAGYNIVIVSGLAIGIDTIAHEAALSAGLVTLALPGSGLDPKVLHPQMNLSLTKKIVEKGGALISEFEPKFQATRWSFPQRNRVMAGMSHATLVVEAGMRSGTLITSKLATEYNRDVMAVPGSVFSAGSAGPHMLIRLGARLVQNASDVLEMLGFDVAAQEPDREKIYANASPEERKIIDLLSTPLPRDELIRALGLSTSMANVILSAMEIKGLIVETMGEVRLC